MPSLYLSAICSPKMAGTISTERSYPTLDVYKYPAGYYPVSYTDSLRTSDSAANGNPAEVVKAIKK